MTIINRKFKAFTMTELLVVLVIIGILVLLAFPVLEPLIFKAKSTEAKLQLKHLYTLQKTHHNMYAKFSTDLEDLGFEQEKLVTENGDARYQIEVVSADNRTFVARATAVEDFNGNGVFNIWEIDQDKDMREVQKD